MMGQRERMVGSGVMIGFSPVSDFLKSERRLCGGSP